MNKSQTRPTSRPFLRKGKQVNQEKGEVVVVVVDSQEGVQCLLEQSLVKLSREQSRSLVDVMLSQRSDDDSTSLPWSSPLDVETGRSSFRGILG